MQSPSNSIKLPRQLETHESHALVEQALLQDLKPLWEKGTLQVLHIPFSPAFEKALVKARISNQLVRGLDQIEKILLNEERGIAAAREKQGTPLANRISRLLLMSDENSERFYRTCESVLLHHANRVLGLRLAVPSDRLAKNLYGGDNFVQALLVSDRDEVTNLLLSLVDA